MPKFSPLDSLVLICERHSEAIITLRVVLLIS
jgi:hypothetical protein